MGTRAIFWNGDPRDEGASWLGCVAFDGYPEGDVGEALRDVKTEAEFILAIARLATARSDFADPTAGGFPFPWPDDVFLTDYSYVWKDGRVMVAHFYHGLVPLEEVLTAPNELPEEDELIIWAREGILEAMPHGLSVGRPYDPGQPDSVLIVAGRGRDGNG